MTQWYQRVRRIENSECILRGKAKKEEHVQSEKNVRRKNSGRRKISAASFSTKESTLKTGCHVFH